ncbi:MAG: nuclear transport factor 2 family protein, partial [Cyanobacteria bacterium P01_D01_bin.2]
WAEDAVQDMPFSPEGFPKRVEGRDNLIQHYAAWPEISGDASFTDELVFYPMADPTMVFAEWRGVVDILPTGRLYEQQYGGLFHVVDGQIQLFREYYNPIVFSVAFGLDENNPPQN